MLNRCRKNGRKYAFHPDPFMFVGDIGLGLTEKPLHDPRSKRNDFNEDTTNETSKSASVVCSNVRLWKLNTQKEWRRLWDERAGQDSAGFMDSKENKCVGSWQSCSNCRHCQSKEASIYYGHTRRKQGSCLEMDNVNTWTGLPVEESVRMTENRDKWRRYSH